MFFFKRKRGSSDLRVGDPVVVLEDPIPSPMELGAVYTITNTDEQTVTLSDISGKHKKELFIKVTDENIAEIAKTIEKRKRKRKEEQEKRRKAELSRVEIQGTLNSMVNRIKIGEAEIDDSAEIAEKLTDELHEALRDQGIETNIVLEDISIANRTITVKISFNSDPENTTLNILA